MLYRQKDFDMMKKDFDMENWRLHSGYWLVK